MQNYGMYKDGKYVLPELPYAYNALEPLYDEQTVRLHHDKHHAAYVNGLNAALEKLEAARKTNNFADVKALSKAVAFHGSGHILHSLFWHSMRPGGAGEIPGELEKAMKDSFGTVEACKAQFAAAAKDVEGSGWAILAYEPFADKLLILQAEKHQDLTVWGVQPLLVCDVWEHAYYLKYQNRRAEWVDAFMKMADWQFAAERLAQAKCEHNR
jgi:Fe-Mn family superoxide dismutase